MKRHSEKAHCDLTAVPEQPPPPFRITILTAALTVSADPVRGGRSPAPRIKGPTACIVMRRSA